MCELEALEAVAPLALLPHHVQDAVHQLRPLRVVALCPVVASPTLPKDKVVRPEDLAVGAAPDGVHGAWLKVDKDGPGDVLASRGLVVVHIDPLQLKVRGAGIASSRVNPSHEKVKILNQSIICQHSPVLVRDDLPELKEYMMRICDNFHGLIAQCSFLSVYPSVAAGLCH